MSKQDDIRRELLADFRAGTRERIETITHGWMQLEKNPRDEEVSSSLMRQLHSLKGEAKMMSFLELSQAAHHVESLIQAVAAGHLPITDAIGDFILAAADDFAQLLETASGSADAGRRLASLAQRAEALIGEQPAEEPGEQSAEEPAEQQAPEPKARQAASQPGEERRGNNNEQFLRINVEQFAVLADLASESVIAHSGYEAEARRLQQGLLQANELCGSAARSPEALSALSSLLADLEAAALVHYYRIYDGGLQAREFEHLARRLRLVPIRGLLQRHTRAARDLAKELGKTVNVDVDDRDTVVDKSVADRLAEPLLHLMRNSIDHGIEKPEARTKRGKPPAGKISLTAAQDGRWIIVTVADDGAGVDLAAVRQRAVERGLVTSEAAANLDEAETIALLFIAGFSTRHEISQTSGRGVGLDVVKRQVEAIGGRVRMTSVPGRGSAIELRVPATVALARMLVIEVGHELYALPSSAVEAVLEVDEQSITMIRDRPTIRFRDQNVPLVPAAAILGFSDSTTRRAVILRDESNMLALGVPGWRGDVEVVVKPFGSFLNNTRLVTGACVLGESDVAPMLNPLELIARASGHEQVQVDLGGEATADELKRILLVEDSSITRAMLARILRALGYDVIEAVDGQAGLEMLSGRDVDLVLTDIDMPRMNGFQLVEKIRSKKQWEHLPIVILSTRGSADDKRRALDAGADAYLVKTEFSEEALRDVIGAKIG